MLLSKTIVYSIVYQRLKFYVRNQIQGCMLQKGFCQKLLESKIDTFYVRNQIQGCIRQNIIALWSYMIGIYEISCGDPPVSYCVQKINICISASGFWRENIILWYTITFDSSISARYVIYSHHVRLQSFYILMNTAL